MNSLNQNQAFKGIARYVTWHEENIYCDVPAGEENSLFPVHLLTFQVELLDNTGSTVGWIPVELRLLRIKNICQDGDEVEVTGEMGEDNILSANSVHNLKTKAMVTTDNHNFISSGPDRTFWGVGIVQKINHSRIDIPGVTVAEGLNKKGKIINSYRDFSHGIIMFNLVQSQNRGMKIFPIKFLYWRNKHIYDGNNYYHNGSITDEFLKLFLISNCEVEVYGKLCSNGTITASRILNLENQRMMINGLFILQPNIPLTINDQNFSRLWYE